MQEESLCILSSSDIVTYLIKLFAKIESKCLVCFYTETLNQVDSFEQTEIMKNTSFFI